MRKGSKTLLILSPGFPKNETDSTCLPFLQQFVHGLRTQYPHLQLVIFALDYPFTRSVYLWNKVRVFSFNGWKKSKISKLYSWWLVLRKMRKIRQEDEIIGILSLWCGPCALIGSRFANRNRLKHFCWIQGQDARKGNRYVSLSKVSSGELIAISDFIQSEFEKNYGLRPEAVIPAGVAASSSAGNGKARPVDLLGVGSLIPLKQYSVFIEILHLVRVYKSDLHAVICGNGPEQIKLKELARKFDLQDNLIFTGELSHDEVLEMMKRSKIFLHTSSYEGICVSCIEALAAGAHVLSFVQLMNDPVPHWHILPGASEMVDEIRSILSSPETEYDAVNAFTIEESVQKIIQLFNYSESAIS
jgi:glycosyltransferase involved in cell wall biosynthesis